VREAGRGLERQLHHFMGALTALAGDKTHATRIAWRIRRTGVEIVNGAAPAMVSCHACLVHGVHINMHKNRIKLQ